MKKLLFAVLILCSISTYSQSLIAKTEDGRRVLLKKDNTWEFIDAKPTTEKSAPTINSFSIYLFHVKISIVYWSYLGR